ncbi:hypothetical protein K490DRAFT_57308 [Saccharata proteae CBS 121410]|uniref:Uncharacterized protein n=1 Tax=Saccharata proteae CBS 121410 TaxID=1314787 RepID=A0A9P4HWC7_9PEZI|nr:hypothetical protein K490DRAFT_57308 [Saccharata proteae CBS 121410]
MASFVIGWGVILTVDYLRGFLSDDRATHLANLTVTDEDRRSYETSDPPETSGSQKTADSQVTPSPQETTHAQRTNDLDNPSDSYKTSGPQGTSGTHKTSLQSASPVTFSAPTQRHNATVTTGESHQNDSSNESKTIHQQSDFILQSPPSAARKISSSGSDIELAISSKASPSTSDTSASDNKSKEVKGSGWIMIGDFIEHNEEFVGYSKEWHEGKLKEIQEDHEDQIDELKASHEQELETFAVTAWNERLQLLRNNAVLNDRLNKCKDTLNEQSGAVTERDNAIQNHERAASEQGRLLVQRDREIAKLRLDMDALKDQITLQEPSAPTHPQDWQRMAAQHRSAQRTNMVLDDFGASHMARITQLTQQLEAQANRTKEAEEVVTDLRKDIDRAPWRNDQLLRYNAKQKSALDAADQREAQLGGRINRAESRIRQLRAHVNNLEAQQPNYTSSAQLLAAIERLHAYCRRHLHTLEVKDGKDAVKEFADWHKEILESVAGKTKETDELKNVNDCLVKSAEDAGEKIRILENKNTTLENQNQALDRLKNEKETALLNEEMKSGTLEEQVENLRLDASMKKGLENLVKLLRSLLMHDWTEAVPAEWRNNIVYMREEVERVTDENEQLKQRLVPLETNYDAYAQKKRMYEVEERAFSNVWGRYAIEFNARVDLNNLCNSLRRRLGEPEVALIVGGDDNAPLMPNMFARRYSDPDQYDLTLEARDGKYYEPREFEGLQDGNDLIVWGALEKNEDGAYVKGHNSWWLGDGNPSIPVGPSKDHYHVSRE